MEFLHDAFIYLLAAVIAVPLANRLGLGSVLGYLIAGIFIGPLLGFVGSETEEIKHFAEFGVVMMLFLVGLELRPTMLWEMRNKLLGLGGLQVLGTTVIVFLGALLFKLPWQSALAIGMIVALSSTAIVLQTLEEKGWMKSTAGQSAFSVLLFQDIAVIPMLAILPLLVIGDISTTVITPSDGHHGSGGIDHLAGWQQTVIILAVIFAIIVAGRYLIRPVFRFIAESHLREIFTAAALLLVIGIALLMEVIGLSPALGTFLAGVVLSDSEYRHELESDIAPFKGLLLGLFFISVGAGIDFELLFDNPALIVGVACGIMVIKFLVLFFLGKIFYLRKGEIWLFGLSLSQAGEFAFVLFGFAKTSQVLSPEIAEIMTLIVAVTMLLTPLLFIIYSSIIVPRSTETNDRQHDTIEDKGTALIAGIGRFGFVVSRMLTTNGYTVVVIDHDPALIDMLRKIGIEAYYGDATRPDLLHTAGIEHAKLFVAALDDKERQTLLVEHVHHTAPNCAIIARALSNHHVYELEKAGACYIELELLESALSAGKRALIELGTHPFKAERQARSFRKHHIDTIQKLRETQIDSQLFIDTARAQVAALYDIMKSDRNAERHDTSEKGWVPPPKNISLSDDFYP